MPRRSRVGAHARALHGSGWRARDTRSTISSFPIRSRRRSRRSRKARAGGCSRTARCCGIRCSRSPRRGRRCCAGCTGASACTRWRRAARAMRPGSCWRSTAAARAGASSYRLPAPVAIDELHLLWRREMVDRVVSSEVGGACKRPIAAWSRWHSRSSTTIRNTRASSTIEDQARVIANAAGAFGSSLDYLERTRVALVTHGIIDPYLERWPRESRCCAKRSDERSRAGASNESPKSRRCRPPSTSSVSPVT